VRFVYSAPGGLPRLARSRSAVLITSRGPELADIELAGGSPLPNDGLRRAGLAQFGSEERGNFFETADRPIGRN
jgi:hypothetical protein